MAKIDLNELKTIHATAKGLLLAFFRAKILTSKNIKELIYQINRTPSEQNIDKVMLDELNKFN